MRHWILPAAFALAVSACGPGKTELSVALDKGRVKLGEHLNIVLELDVQGRVPVRTRAEDNFSVQIGLADVGAPAGAMASGLAGVEKGAVRTAKNEKITAVVSGVFKRMGRGVRFYRDGGGAPVAVGPPGTVDVVVGFTPYTDDQNTLYAGESFAKKRLTIVER